MFSEAGKTMTDVEKRAAKLQLPDAPASESGAVKVWEQDVAMLTYMPRPADVNPMFLKKRVYQGSNGEVYPLPFIDRIESEPTMRDWKAIHLENRYVRLMVMPEIGGRIHIGLDKTNGYDFFYRQNVIKPALVGLAGPWISGGVEFNWPQHHRPQTFMPVETEIERHADGSVTVWCSDYDRSSGMKGMHGVCLHPDRALVELKARLYNGTERVQTFLWWANVAAKVHEDYQAFFPPDVRFVADHAKRAVSSFPLADASYYGVNYGVRAVEGVPEEDAPAEFKPHGYAANDLTRYANIPVPTSYMIVQTEGDFFGGYDHAADAGFVHVANRHISPGKKQWTWGNHEFGYAWDRALTEDDGPYVELMAGVYTDNQPDFSFLLPGETKTFSQFWYPLRKMGLPRVANLDAALSLEARDGVAKVSVCVTREFAAAKMVLRCGESVLREWSQKLTVEAGLADEVALPSGCDVAALSLSFAADGAETLVCSLAPAPEKDAPAMAFEPPLPEIVESADKLYLIGLHLEQYRHATRSPEGYWLEALKRDVGDVRCNHSLAKLYWKRGEYERALEHARAAVERATWLNPNPQDGEVYYTLGLVLRTMGRAEDAYAAFYKSTWNAAWRSPAYYAIAEIDSERGALTKALEHVQLSLRTNTDNLNARNLCVALMRRLGVHDDADALLAKTRALDPLDHWSRWMETGVVPEDGHSLLALGLTLERCGFVDDAIAVLQYANFSRLDGSGPLIHLALARCYDATGKVRLEGVELDAAMEATPTYCFPNGAAERALLEFGLAKRPESARLHYYFGNLMFQAGQPDAAIQAWGKSAKLDGSLAQVWRNLGIAYFNIRHDAEAAQRAFVRAVAADPKDARILYERDQLAKRVGVKPALRLEEMLQHRELVSERDDLSVELATLLNQQGRPAEALDILLARSFQPWEGGEGLVLTQFVRAKLLLGQAKLAMGDAKSATEDFAAALQPPRSLGEAKHLLANRADVYFWLGEAKAAMGNRDAALQMYERSVKELCDPQQPTLRAFSELTYWSGLALYRLGREREAKKLFEDVVKYSVELEKTMPTIDYFATSLPNLLLFEDDLMERQRIEARALRAMALAGLGRVEDSRILLSEVLSVDPNRMALADVSVPMQSMEITNAGVK